MAAQPKRADVGAAANLSHLTGRQAGKPRASELQAETREARLAIDRLRLRLQLSCPPPPLLAGSFRPFNAAAPAGASRNEDPFSLYVFGRLTNCGRTIRYTNTLRLTR